MVKAMFLLKRKPGLTPAEFRQQYEEVHAPLALSLFPNLRRYVRNYIATNVIAGSAAEPDFDCIAEQWFDDMEGFQAMIDTMTGTSAGHASQALGHSAQVFLDTTKTALVLVEEVESEIG